jgi:hypothetical protein
VNENGNDEPYLRKTKKAIENGAKKLLQLMCLESQQPPLETTLMEISNLALT